MHLALFVAVLVSLPPQTPPPQGAGPPEAIRSPSGLELRVVLRTRGATPGAAALEIDRLLAALRDSLKGQHFTDSTVGVALRSITPSPTSPDHPVAGFDAALRLTLAPRELPRLPKIIELLSAAAGDEVTDIQFGGGVGEAVPGASSPSVGSRLSTLALLLLAIRREVRQ